MKTLLSVTLLYLLCFSAYSQTFQSSKNQTAVLELYSSQGCSSCPPAEKWVSSLLADKNLWATFVPVVFHVDYWNSLGWDDPFSDKAYSQRQRQYYRQSLIRSVYTPGFILNGQEWRSWFLRSSVPVSKKTADILSAQLINTKLFASYPSNVPLVLNVALLGFDLKTFVSRGENTGRNFSENFTVLSFQTSLSDTGEWNIDLIKQQHNSSGRYALAIWINTADSLIPLQATGGWLIN